MTKAEITAKIEAIKKNSAMPEKQKGQLLAVYEKKLAELKEEPKEEPKKKEEAKPKTEAKTEGKSEGKPEAKATSKPKRDDTDDDSECVELEEREEKAKKSGYDLDELLSKAKENKAKAKKRAQERANEPKKTPATRNREAVSRTTERVTANIEGRAKKGTVNIAEIEKIIAQHEESIVKLKKIIASLKGGKKMARGGGVEGKISQIRKKYPRVSVVQSVSGDYIEVFSKNENTIYKIQDEFGGDIDHDTEMDTYMLAIASKYGEGGGVGTPIEIEERLEELRQAIRDENISYGEIAELQSLVRYINDGDVELLEWAGVDEQDLAQYGMPIAICNRTGSFVYPTEVEGYYGYCPELDEDLYKMETTPLMARGGRTTPRTVRTDIKRDKIYQSMPSGKRKSQRVSEIEKTDGTSFLRRNANQYYNDKDGIYGKRKEIGKRTYYESANNRSDRGTLSGL
jgi:hypothetical protein